MELSTLEEMGLTKNESLIFFTLVKSNGLSATDIAKSTGLNRPYVYYALERLLEKGYLSQVKVRGKRNFKAVESKHLIALEEKKVVSLKKFMKEIEKEKKKSSEETSVEVFKGKSTIKNLHKKLFSEVRSGEEILYLGIDEEKMEKLEPVYLERILRHFQKNKITERAIIPFGGKRLSYAKTTRYRQLDKKILGNAAKIIYQNKVIEIIYANPLYAVVIENGELAKTAKEQFEIFWKTAKR